MTVVLLVIAVRHDTVHLHKRSPQLHLSPAQLAVNAQYFMRREVNAPKPVASVWVRGRDANGSASQTLSPNLKFFFSSLLVVGFCAAFLFLTPVNDNLALMRRRGAFGRQDLHRASAPAPDYRAQWSAFERGGLEPLAAPPGGSFGGDGGAGFGPTPEERIHQVQPATRKHPCSSQPCLHLHIHRSLTVEMICCSNCRHRHEYPCQGVAYVIVPINR